MFSREFQIKFKIGFSIILIILLIYVFLNVIATNIKISSKDYKNNIVNEVVEGTIIESNKTQTTGLLSGSIIYETAIEIDNEIIISNDKEIYYRTKDKINEEVEVEIENNKNTGNKKILDIK